jgi:phosphinothricin acetyltransferase
MIRAAKTEDADALASIYNHYINNTVISFEETALSGEEMALRVNKVIGYGLPWLVAETDAEVVAYAYATRWHERRAYKHSVEVSAYVSSTMCSKGWGTRLYEPLFEELNRLSIHAVMAGIALPNAGSVALHEKFGMKKVAHFTEVGFKFGQWIDVGYWQVNLNA